MSGKERAKVKAKTEKRMPVEIVIDGTRYAFAEPGLKIQTGTDSHGRWIAFSHTGTLDLKEVADSPGVCGCADCAFRGMEACAHRQQMDAYGRLAKAAKPLLTLGRMIVRIGCGGAPLVFRGTLMARIGERCRELDAALKAEGGVS